ncbi:unnamed protein product [Didymodactylos carnosus]|uniref:Uncharacterized protein n=1 Tax=Didymodactylos carnosus TaxID=1234261 RepID=A0A815L376_9BILA|nr:unnamed protein product [Didymodactylos carnosus]CAF1401181.1 unnamed protein product [Didymodactylos carnosus]CAF4002888.1 unnamed protein product [Didymodactylos carnosus]CAF4295007.1 unnamed protein product [Didymodactylos carnosus]
MRLPARHRPESQIKKFRLEMLGDCISTSLAASPASRISWESNTGDPLNHEAAAVFEADVNTFKANVSKTMAGGILNNTQHNILNADH